MNYFERKAIKTQQENPFTSILTALKKLIAPFVGEIFNYKGNLHYKGGLVQKSYFRREPFHLTDFRCRPGQPLFTRLFSTHLSGDCVPQPQRFQTPSSFLSSGWHGSPSQLVCLVILLVAYIDNIPAHK